MNDTFDILDFIPKGKENAVTNKDIQVKTGLPEREIRKYVHDARRTTCIINNQDGRGYYQPTEKAEVERFIKQERSRALSVLWSLKGAKQYLKHGLE